MNKEKNIILTVCDECCTEKPCIELGLGAIALGKELIYVCKECLSEAMENIKDE